METQKLHNALTMHKGLQNSISTLCYQAGAVSKCRKHLQNLKAARRNGDAREEARLKELVRIGNEMPMKIIETKAQEVLDRLAAITMHVDTSLSPEAREYFILLNKVQNRIDRDKKKMWSLLKK